LCPIRRDRPFFHILSGHYIPFGGPEELFLSPCRQNFFSPFAPGCSKDGGFWARGLFLPHRETFSPPRRVSLFLSSYEEKGLPFFFFPLTGVLLSSLLSLKDKTFFHRIFPRYGLFLRGPPAPGEIYPVHDPSRGVFITFPTILETTCLSFPRSRLPL